MSFPYYMIYAPVGGFGNHLRWLLLLNKNYKLELKNYQSLVEPKDKAEFINQVVYSQERTYHNWLNYEWTWRTEIDYLLKFTHDMTDFFDDLKSVALIVDPELAFRSYVKFNPTLNQESKHDFLKQIEKQNRLCEVMANALDTVICINSTKLFQPTLDMETYNRVLKFFNLESNFDEAQSIHQTWYNLHIKAENEWVASQL